MNRAVKAGAVEIGGLAVGAADAEGAVVAVEVVGGGAGARPAVEEVRTFVFLGIDGCLVRMDLQGEVVPLGAEAGGRGGIAVAVAEHQEFLDGIGAGDGNLDGADAGGGFVGLDLGVVENADGVRTGGAEGDDIAVGGVEKTDTLLEKRVERAAAAHDVGAVAVFGVGAGAVAGDALRAGPIVGVKDAPVVAPFVVGDGTAQRGSQPAELAADVGHAGGRHEFVFAHDNPAVEPVGVLRAVVGPFPALGLHGRFGGGLEGPAPEIHVTGNRAGQGEFRGDDEAVNVAVGIGFVSEPCLFVGLLVIPGRGLVELGDQGAVGGRTGAVAAAVGGFDNDDHHGLRSELVAVPAGPLVVVGVDRRRARARGRIPGGERFAGSGGEPGIIRSIERGGFGFPRGSFFNGGKRMVFATVEDNLRGGLSGGRVAGGRRGFVRGEQNPVVLVEGELAVERDAEKRRVLLCEAVPPGSINAGRVGPVADHDIVAVTVDVQRIFGTAGGGVLSTTNCKNAVESLTGDNLFKFGLDLGWKLFPNRSRHPVCESGLGVGNDDLGESKATLFGQGQALYEQFRTPVARGVEVGIDPAVKAVKDGPGLLIYRCRIPVRAGSGANV